MTHELLKEAIELIQAGNTTDARRLLNQVLEDDPDNEVAWLWYADTLGEDAERIQALEQYLVINPDSQKARMAYDQLIKRRSKTEVVEENFSQPSEDELLDIEPDLHEDTPKPKRSPRRFLPVIVTIGIFIIVVLAFALFALLLIQIGIL